MKYGYQKEIENTAKAAMKDVGISSKSAIEMANHLRYKTTTRAKKELTEIQKMEKALPFKRFHNGLGHKKGEMMSGRYPIKAAAAFLQLIESVEANASNSTLGSNLKIVHLSANRASNSFRFGRRQRRQKRKLTHLEIIVKEVEEKKKVAKAVKKVAETPKVKETEVKAEVKKIEEKTSESSPDVKKAEAPKETVTKVSKPVKKKVESKEKSEAKPEATTEIKEKTAEAEQK